MVELETTARKINQSKTNLMLQTRSRRRADQETSFWGCGQLPIPGVLLDKDQRRDRESPEANNGSKPDLLFAAPNYVIQRRQQEHESKTLQDTNLSNNIVSYISKDRRDSGYL